MSSQKCKEVCTFTILRNSTKLSWQTMLENNQQTRSLSCQSSPKQTLFLDKFSQCKLGIKSSHPQRNILEVERSS